MPDLTFDFTWFHDPKGYRLIPAKPITLRIGQSLLNIRSSDIQAARVVRNGGKLQSYRPFDVSKELFKIFIDKAKSESGVLKFIETFGPLTYDGLKGRGEIVPNMIDEADTMTEALRGRIIAMQLNTLKASIVTEGNKIRLKVSPACLLDALWLQVAQAKADVRQCLQCNTPFVGRRADAKFCSDACRIRYNSDQRSR
jgi:hypothetical protein